MCFTRVYGFELMMSRLCCVRTGIAYSGNVDNSVAPPTATTLKQCGNDRKLGTHSDVSCSTDVTVDKTRVWFNQFSSKKHDTFTETFNNYLVISSIAQHWDWLGLPILFHHSRPSLRRITPPRCTMAFTHSRRRGCM